MALSLLEKSIIARAAKIAQQLQEVYKPLLEELNVIYDAEGGLKSTITDENLAADASLSGLTKANLDDAMYALTATLRTDLQNGAANLAKLAARASQLGG